MISTHPCWLERIAYLKSSSTLEQLAFINAAVYPQVAANHLVLAKQLDEYQASPVWPLLVDFMEPKLQGSKDDYHKCISIRSRAGKRMTMRFLLPFSAAAVKDILALSSCLVAGPVVDQTNTSLWCFPTSDSVAPAH
ncbi:hypothetical protein WJX77_002263 [Trebouxia sp. C0004]